MNKKFKFLIGVVIVCIITFAIYQFNVRSSTTSVQVEEFKEAIVKQGNIKISFMADGIADLPILKLRFPVSGQLKELLVNVGESVQKGTAIAKLDDKDYISKIESAKINYEQAIKKLEKTKQQYISQLALEKSKLDSSKFQLDSAYLQYKPMLQIPEAYTIQEIEAKKMYYENLKAAYEAADEAYNLLQKGSLDVELDEINVRQLKAALTSAEDALENTLVIAPAKGDVLAISHKPGETVSNSTDFAIISSSSKPDVVAQVSELDISKIEIGMAVEMEFEALTGQNIKGKVVSVNPLATIEAGGIVSYNVNIEFDSTVTGIRDGMTCIASFILKQKQGILIIPNSTVKRVDGAQVVEVKDQTGNIISKTIKTGLTDGTYVEVTEGLNAGEILIIRSKK